MLIKRCAGETYYYSGSTTLLNCNPLNLLARRGDGSWLLDFFLERGADSLFFFLSLPSSRIPSSTRENVKVRRYNVAASVFSILSCCAHEYTRVYMYIYGLDARIHIIVGICPLLRFVAALQKVGEGIISGFRGGRPAIRKLETRPGARYSVRGREGGELKQRDAGVRRRGREKEIRRERIGIPRVQGT